MIKVLKLAFKCYAFNLLWYNAAQLGDQHSVCECFVIFYFFSVISDLILIIMCLSFIAKCVRFVFVVYAWEKHFAQRFKNSEHLPHKE